MPKPTPRTPDEYRAENIFWVPPAARWTYLQNSAKQPTIGKIADDAMIAIELDNPRLKGILLWRRADAQGESGRQAKSSRSRILIASR
jgi:type I restriction-modification system DNA methylase subunit